MKQTMAKSRSQFVGGGSLLQRRESKPGAASLGASPTFGQDFSGVDVHARASAAPLRGTCASTVNTKLMMTPRPMSPGVCPIGGSAPWLTDPEIKSTSKCRGACGRDCKYCKKVAPVLLPIPATNPGFYRWCTYENVVRCPTHETCRDHDNCFDCAAERGELRTAGRTHIACDVAAFARYGPRSLRLLFGTGPYTEYLNYSAPPEISPAIPGPVPAVGP